LAFLMAPAMPRSLGVRTISAPKALRRRRRRSDMLSGMVTIELVAAGGAGEGQADAGVAAGRLDDRGVLVDAARGASLSLRHATLQPTALVHDAYLRLTDGPVALTDLGMPAASGQWRWLAAPG
jgi:hypothetical protein